MGFDGFDPMDFLDDIEESFGIIIDKKTANKLITMEDVHKYLLDNLDTTQLNDYCNSQKAFYLLRRSLINDCGLKRKDIVPSQLTEDCFPLADRRQQWKKLSKSLSLKLPCLLGQSSFETKAGRILLFLLLLFFYGMWTSNHLMMYLVSPVIIGWLIGSAILGGTKYVTVIPSSCKTIGGLSKTIVAYNSSNFSSGKYTKKEIWDILCNLISAQFEQELKGIKPETVYGRYALDYDDKFIGYDNNGKKL